MDGKSPMTLERPMPTGRGSDVILDALGDRTRRSVLERLREGPKPVVEIARGLPVSRPAVSQHLKVLKEAGLVVDEHEGTRRFYRIDPGALEALREYVDQFWDGALSRFAATAEAATDENP